MVPVGADIGVDAHVGRGPQRSRHDDPLRVAQQRRERQRRRCARLAGEADRRASIGVDRRDQRDLAVAQAGDHRQPPAREPRGGRRQEAHRQAGGAGDRADPRVAFIGAFPLRGEARALVGHRQAVMARDLADQVDPRLAVIDGRRRWREERRVHSVTPPIAVPDRPKASRAPPE